MTPDTGAEPAQRPAVEVTLEPPSRPLLKLEREFLIDLLSEKPDGAGELKTSMKYIDAIYSLRRMLGIAKRLE